MVNTMNVALVAADREIWSGEATVVNTLTLAGEIGIMADHTPLLSVLEAGQVDVRTADEGHWVAAIDGGFISVANNRVSILSEDAFLADEIDAAAAQSELEAAQEGDDPDAILRAEAKLNVIDKAS